jgi:hypothetical protein
MENDRVRVTAAHNIEVTREMMEIVDEIEAELHRSVRPTVFGIPLNH